MKQLHEINKEDKQEINDQIVIRRELVDRMVGQLYTSIVWDEISMLRSWL